jgi:hypothetical protein
VHRRAVASWVERQVLAYRGSHFVITSRPHGYRDVVIPQATVTAICTFTWDQIERFLEGWYAAAERRSTGARTKAELRSAQISAEASVAKLRGLLQARPVLRDLAVNPLLLTMIAIVYRERNDLPGSRADLYREICQVMLSRRIRSKGLEELVPWEARRKILASLGYQMMAAHVNELDAAAAARSVASLLRRLPDYVTPEDFLSDIIRNGLLVEVAPDTAGALGRLAFSHLTFQEYFAAQHAAATIEAEKALKRSITDRWWRETILLYAAASDASDLVRACLDDGTLPAVALAFDCANASSAVDPEARLRLEDTRRQAYEPGCPASQRRLIAGIEAMRLADQAAGTTSGIRVCSRPVPADLYWLFLQDTGAAPPDVPCEPGSGEPATGMWAGEARDFVAWLNEVTADSGLSPFRLPNSEELSEHPPASPASAWTAGGGNTELWVRPGAPHPHGVSAEALQQFISDDQVARRMMAATACAHAFAIDLALAVDLALVLALDRDFAGIRTLTMARTDTLALGLVSDLNLALALDPDLARALDHRLDHRLGNAGATSPFTFDFALGRILDLARTLGSALASTLDLALDVALGRALDPYLARPLGPAQGRLSDARRAFALALALARDHDQTSNPARAVFGYSRAGAFNVASASLGATSMRLGVLSGFPLRWVACGPLGNVAWAAASAQQLTSKGFTERLLAAAGVGPGGLVHARLDNSLLASLVGRVSSEGDTRSDWHKGLSFLDASCSQPETDACGTPGTALIALALAADTEANGFQDEKAVLRDLAATMALARQRANGTRKPTEAIVLAFT